MSITPQAMRAIGERIGRLELRAHARPGNAALNCSIVKCGSDGLLHDKWGALPPGVGLAVVAIPAGKFLDGKTPQQWAPTPDLSAFAPAWDAHLDQAAHAAAAGTVSPVFVPPPVAYRIRLEDAPERPSAYRVPPHDVVVPLRGKPKAKRDADEEFRKRYGTP
jgi:hypothetical protein